MGYDSGHDRQRRADQHRRLATPQLRRLDKLWRHAVEKCAGEDGEYSPRALAANGWHSNRGTDGATLWYQSADVALPSVGARRDRSAVGPDGLRLFGVPEQRHSRRAAHDSQSARSRWGDARRVGKDDVQSDERVRRADD